MLYFLHCNICCGFKRLLNENYLNLSFTASMPLYPRCWQCGREECFQGDSSLWKRKGRKRMLMTQLP